MYSKIRIINIKHIINEIGDISGDIQALNLDIDLVCRELRKQSIYYDSIKKLHIIEDEISDEAHIMHNLYRALEDINYKYNITESGIIDNIDHYNMDY